MKRVCLLGLAALTACGGRSDGGLLLMVEVDPQLGATCVRAEVEVAGEVRGSSEVAVKDKTTFKIAVKQGELPSQVQLRARAFRSASGCETPRELVSVTAPQSAAFPSSSVETVKLALAPPGDDLDHDRDGFITVLQGGSDCDDGNAAVSPKAAQICNGKVDNNCDGKIHCQDPACSSEPSCVTRATHLTFITASLPSVAGACSAALSVELRDVAGETAFADADLAVALSASMAGVSFFADAACSQEVSQVPLGFGASTASFYFKALNAGEFTATAAIPSLLAAAQLQSVQSAALVFANPARVAIAGACSASLDLEARDGQGRPETLTSAMAVNLTANPATGVSFFSDANCGSALSGATLSLPVGATGGRFFVRAQKTGSISINAAPGRAVPVTQPLTINPAAVAKLAFTSMPQGLAALACSSPTTVDTQDAFGNTSPSLAALSVALAVSGGSDVTLFSDSGCGAPLPGSAVTVAAGSSRATFYFSGSKAGARTLRASAGSLTGDSQVENIGVGPAAKLAITSVAQTVRAGLCSTAVTFQVQDVAGNPSNAPATLLVDLAASPTTGFAFFSDSACSTPATQATVAVGASGQSFYFKATQAGAISVQLSAAGLTAASQTQTVTPSAASQVAFSSAVQSITAGNCGAAFTVQLRDAYGNVATALASSPVALSSSAGPLGQTFYASPNCSGASAVAIGAGQSSVSFGLRPTEAGSHTLTAQVGGLAPADQLLTVAAADAAKLVVVSTVQTVAAAACSNALTVQRRDSFDNATARPLAQAFTLGANPSTGLTFHLSAGCADAPVTAGSIAANASSQDVYFSSTRAGVVTLSASAAGLSTGSQGTTVTALAPAQLHITTDPRRVDALSCSPNVNVALLDAYDNSAVATAPMAVSLSAAGSSVLTFDTNQTCGGSVNQATVAAGASSVDTFFRGADVGTATLTVSASGLASDSQLEMVLPSAPSSLLFATGSTTLETGACVKVSVTRNDSLGRPTAWSQATPVSLAATAGLALYSNEQCTSASSSATIAGGAASAEIFVKAVTQANSTSVTGTSGSMTAAQGFTVLPMVRRGSCTLSGAQTSTSCAIAPALGDIGRTFLVFGAASDDDSPAGSNVSCGLTAAAGAAQVNCTREGALLDGGVAEIAWQTVSFAKPYSAGGVSVQHLRQSWVQPVANPMTVALSQAVDAGDSFTLVSTQSSGTGNAHNDFFTARLSASQVALQTGETPITINGAAAVQVVSFAGVMVTRPNANLAMSTSNVSITPVGLSSVDVGRSILLYTSRSDTTSTGNQICSHMLRGKIVSGTDLLFSRGAGTNPGTGVNCKASNLESIEYERVQFPSGTQVTGADVSLSAGTAQTTVAMPTALDVSRTLFLIGGQGPSGQATGESSFSANDVLGSSTALTTFNSVSQPVVKRGNSTSAAAFRAYFVQFSP